MLTGACGVCDVALGFIVISLSAVQSHLGVNLQKSPLLGKLATVLNVFRLNDLSHGMMDSKLFEMAFQPLLD